ncbi:MAG: FAD-dependent oxidoreductase [Desulfobacterales bacterium]|jgi:2,4-dienoyl-CoA reductase-like NADH-dependent reductase (Old Yellow Enzyme family)/thioredoxin reductase|nr:FAD-dependent oxidoreductase [Desulfobacteraceae bacterium]MDY0310870.1 FAD-dependent oxidoreductase [Desulfobacterales bacterium]
MQDLFTPMSLGPLTLANRFVFPPIKTASGTPQGKVTDRQMTFYRQIAHHGPAIVILEPVAVTADGREHPKQLCVHLEDSVAELKKIVGAIHQEDRLACLHLNHGGAAANPKASGTPPRAPSEFTCASVGVPAEALTDSQIDAIVDGYRVAAQRAVAAGFDVIEVQAGHGYLVSQFLNAKINRRQDRYGENRLLFATRVLDAVKAGAPQLPMIVRIAGSEMSPEFGISPEDMAPMLKLAQDKGAIAIHVGMGTSCFSPPWYFHHSSLPEKPQNDALSWVRSQTGLPIIAAGRMGRADRVRSLRAAGAMDLVALGRPLIADPQLIEKWSREAYSEVAACGYCLQGCLHRVRNGEPIGCNLNPEIGNPPLGQTEKALKVLVAGGGPAGISAALYLARRGHHVTLAEKQDRLGGQFNLAWQAPGKKTMHDGLENLKGQVRAHADQVLTGRAVDLDLVRELAPDLLVWATGAVQNIPAIDGLDSQYTMTSLEYFEGAKTVHGPRVLVIGAGRTGLEIAEKLGVDGLEVVATKRTDPIGSMMELVTKKLMLMRLEKLSNVTLMPHTTVKQFRADGVDVVQDDTAKVLAPFQTVILASGMRSAPGPDEAMRQAVPAVETIGDAAEVMDIYAAVHAGYATAQKY